MNLYLDDDCASRLLAQLLSAAGHDVQRPVMVNLDGALDASHLTHAIRESRVLITGNYDDFEALHDLIIQAGGHHPGIIVIRKENNPRRDLTPRGMVAAVKHLEAVHPVLSDQFVVLNQWR